jgi:hypothetical protein
MPQVPAGNLTGLYYIVVAGLPWQCSWQRLKDFARDQQPDGSCTEIDHALVYPDSTSGWVRVKGIENFRNVMGESSRQILPFLFPASLLMILFSSSEWRYP